MYPDFMSYLKCIVNLVRGITSSQKNTGHLTTPKIIAQSHGHLVKALSWDQEDRCSCVTLGKSDLSGSGSPLQNGCRSLTGSTLCSLPSNWANSSGLRCFLQNFSKIPASTFAKQPTVTQRITNKSMFIKWLGNKVCLSWSWCKVCHWSPFA